MGVVHECIIDDPNLAGIVEIDSSRGPMVDRVIMKHIVMNIRFGGVKHSDRLPRTSSIIEFIVTDLDAKCRSTRDADPRPCRNGRVRINLVLQYDG